MILNIKKKYKKISLRYRLLKYFSAFAIIPIILFSIVISGIMLNETIDRMRDDTKKRFDERFQYIDKQLEEAYQIGNTVSQDSYVRQILNDEFESIEEKYFTEAIINSKLTHMLKYSESNIQAYVIGENGSQFKSSDKSFLEKNFFDEEWYVNTANINNEVWQYPRIGSNIVNSLREEYISLTIPIRKVLKDTILGIIYIDIKIEPYVLEEASSYFYIINQEDTFIMNEKLVEDASKLDLSTIISESRSNIKYWNILESNDSLIHENKNIITIYRKSNINDWIYCSVSTKETIYQNVLVIILVTIAIIFGLIFIAFYTSFRVSKTLINPLINLSKTMEKVQQGDFAARVKTTSNGEIGQLEESFNYMVKDINELMTQIVTEQQKTRQYEIMLLQAQIKPHFLYNTFDSVIWLIRIDEYDDAIKLMQELTIFLRSGLSKGKDTINLEQEVSNVKSYLEIQKFRYKKKLSFEIDIPEEMMNFQVPKLILQPLVENSLYHGIKNKEEGGMIYVYGYETIDEIIIVISDDGVGMDEKKLENMKENDNNSTSYGFKNVYERLSMFYKERFKLDVESEIGIGTTIKIQIRKDDSDV